MNFAPFLAKTLKLAMNFAIAPFLAKNFTLVLAKSFALFLAKSLHLRFSPLEGRWLHTFRCQKRCALRNSSRSSFCFCQMAWQGIESLKQAIEFPAAPSFFPSKKWIKLIPKTIGNRKRDCAWGCARRINTTSENLQIEKRKSVWWAERTPSWFVLFDLQIFWGGVYPPSATERTISFSISNSFWYLIPYRRKDDNRRLRVEIAIRAIASEFTSAWQSHLRAKMAIHGCASELNRMKVKTCEWS